MDSNWEIWLGCNPRILTAIYLEPMNRSTNPCFYRMTFLLLGWKEQIQMKHVVLWL